MAVLFAIVFYVWTTYVIAIGEGSIDPDRGLLAMRYYACVADYLPSIEAQPAQ